MDERTVEAIVDAVLRRLTPAAGAGSVAGAMSPGGELLTADLMAGRVILGVSVRHIHLTDAHVEALFGPGAKLTQLRPLMQPGEFASEQTLTVVSPAGRSIAGVRVLGPTRKATQVELSLTDCFALGLKPTPPIRPSGDHRDSTGITLVGTHGSVTIASGVIRANRHIHLHTKQAEALGLRDGELVRVRIGGERPAVLEECQIRAHPNFRAEMHIDTDDANALGAKTGQMVEILR